MNGDKKKILEHLESLTTTYKEAKENQDLSFFVIGSQGEELTVILSGDGERLLRNIVDARLQDTVVNLLLKASEAILYELEGETINEE